MINSKPKLPLILLILLVAGGIVGGVAADPRPTPEAREITEPRQETFGDYVVHYTAQMTAMVPDRVARSLGITRGPDRAMLNVTVLRRSEEGQPKPLDARIEVTATNLTGQLESIPVREVHDGDSVYYIGEFEVADEEILTFEVRVRPEGADSDYEFSFQQQFFTN